MQRGNTRNTHSTQPCIFRMGQRNWYLASACFSVIVSTSPNLRKLFARRFLDVKLGVGCRTILCRFPPRLGRRFARQMFWRRAQPGLRFGVCGLGLGFGVWGLGFGVWGLGFGVWGFVEAPPPCRPASCRRGHEMTRAVCPRTGCRG